VLGKSISSLKHPDNVLVIVAHPDDEILGCGGTIASHINAGDNICILFLANGESSRTRDNASTEIINRRRAAIAACSSLGERVETVFFDFPDNKLDSVPLLDIVQSMEKVTERVEPSIIYTHHLGDLNIDHQITHQAVMTASRPKTNSSVREIYTFEVLSSTNWSSTTQMNYFKPNKYVDITANLEKKLTALEFYGNELHDFPHARSLDAVVSLAKYRGSSVGIAAAEAFQVERLLTL